MTQTVLITGCSSGFGKATARHFAANGWNVIATMRDTSAADDLATLPNVLLAQLDVEDRASVDAAVAQGIERFGRIDAVVNNAGYGLFAIFEAIPPQDIQKQFDVNLFGAMNAARAILPHFRANRAGTIINVSSGAGVFGAAMASIYSASKFALEGFSEALSYELAGFGIAVKIIEPGGSPATNFIARQQSVAAGLAFPDDYGPFLAHIAGVYGGMAGAAAADAVEKVAASIFAAATDGSSRLRYQPTDDIAPILKARREGSEDAYTAMMRGFFLPALK